jgi:hypothetical protein
MITYSAAYCTENAAGDPVHVFGGFPPAVFSLYTSCRFPVAPSRAMSFNHGTAPLPCPPCPFGASAGAVVLAFFAHGMDPNFCAEVSRLKKGTVRPAKKCTPLTSNPAGLGSAWLGLRLYCKAKFGRIARTCGFVAATQLTL